LAGFFGRIAHTYGTVLYDSDFLWDTVCHDVPVIHRYCVMILSQSDIEGPSEKLLFTLFNRKRRQCVSVV
ncbi:MAG: hypothetical protein ACI38Y_04610, partial [Candidatus Methanomethylophilaceae archaeon]